MSPLLTADFAGSEAQTQKNKLNCFLRLWTQQRDLQRKINMNMKFKKQIKKVSLKSHMQKILQRE